VSPDELQSAHTEESAFAAHAPASPVGRPTRLTIVELENTNAGAPTQWHGTDEAQNPVYVRYQGGTLTVSVGKCGDSIFSAVYGVPVFVAALRHDDAETLTFEALKAATAGVIEWPPIVR
jgi:hypothetical protein